MKNLFKEVDTIIFDNDGTLFQADLVSFPAVVSAYRDLIRIHDLEIDILSKDEINANIGLPAREYFRSLLPEHLHQWTDDFQALCVQHEVINIQKGLGALYEGVEETLTCLKAKGYKLGMITNAGSDYFNAVTETFHYQKYFETYLCLGERTHLTKTDLLKEVLANLKSKKSAMVGDKAGDIEAGKRNGFITIAALYGYGSKDELAKADEKIEQFSKLLTFL